MDRGQVADMIAASEARSETRHAEMNGKLDQLLDKLAGMDAKVSDVKSDNQRTRSTVRTTAIALGGVLLTGMALIVAVANVSFGVGARVADVARREAVQVLDRTEAGRSAVASQAAPSPERERALPTR